MITSFLIYFNIPKTQSILNFVKRELDSEGWALDGNSSKLCSGPGCAACWPEQFASLA